MEDEKTWTSTQRAINFNSCEETVCTTLLSQNMVNQEFIFDQPLRNVQSILLEMVACADFATVANVVVL